jgi:hypothetical protein
VKIAGVVQVDFARTPLGTRSRLADEIGGQTVLRRTIDRLGRVRSLDRVFVLCPSGDVERCTRLLDGSNAVICRCDAPEPAWQSLVRAGRKWALDGWRGGIGGTTHFDEFVRPEVLHSLLQQQPADALLVAPPAAPLLCPELAERMIAHWRPIAADVRLVFTQAPPGVSGVLMAASLVEDLAAKHIPLGWTLSFKPQSPRKDVIFEEACVEVPAGLRHAAARLVADTDRSFARMAALLAEHPDGGVEAVATWLAGREEGDVDAVPHEVEVELTTEDPYPEALLRPRGPRVGSRGPIAPAMVEGVARCLARLDDGLLVLGGFGEPLRHPEFGGILAVVRRGMPADRPSLGLAVRTAGVDLDDARIDLLIDHGVDVVNVILDAWTAPLYARVQSPVDPAQADLARVLANLERLTARCHARGTPLPIVVPEMTKSTLTVGELDAFYSGWIMRTGTVLITGHSHRAGQVDDLAVMSMAPQPRWGCRRIRSRVMVLADGRVTACDQDFAGRQSLGSLDDADLASLWTGAALRSLRDAHAAGRWDGLPLCGACDEWHRP